MKRLIIGCILLALQATSAAADGEEGKEKKSSPWTGKNRLNFESENGDFSFRVGILGQFLYTAADPDFGDSTSSFRTRRVRPDMRGTLFGTVGYRVQYELAGDPNLLDFYLTWGPKASKFQIGQFKAPFGRQELTSIAKQQFVDRSIASKRFAPSRQQGIAILGASPDSRFEYGVGVFNGNGRNQSKDDNSDKMVAGRLVFNVLGKYSRDETPFDYPESPRLSLGVGGVIDTTGDGSTAEDITRFGGEVAFKVKGFGLVAEVFQEEADPTIGAAVDTDGYYAQIGFLAPNKRFEAALRVSEVSPDADGGSLDQSETGVAFNFYINKHSQKLQLDYRQLEFDSAPEKDTDELRAQVTVAF